jgi:TolB-like protein/Flp pilus assembly protein TadD
MSDASGYQRFFAELKRRRVFRLMAAYGAIAFAFLQVADVVFAGLGLPEWVLRVVVVLTLLGFPAALVLSWAFDVTPHGLKKTVEADPREIAEIVSAPAAQRWPAGLLALFGVVALVAGAWWAGRTSALRILGPVQAATADEVLERAYADLEEDGRPSLAVLPFADMSPEGDQEYFADGMSEELLNALVKVKGLRVAGRTSSFAYRNVEMDLRDLGRELGVRYVVEGSVRKQGDRLRITAQLVDANDNFHVWSDTYDRALDDVFAVQEEIASAVAGQLQVSLGLEEGGALVAPTADLEAYDLYLKARARMRERGAGVDEAVKLFEEVVARDSMWAPGWAGLAQAYSLVPYYEASARSAAGIRPERWESALAAAVTKAARALAIDPRVAGADVALGNAYRDRWEWDRAEKHYIRALEIDPDDVEAHQQYSNLLAATGREDEALRSAQRAVALDPTSAIRMNELGWMLFMNGRLTEAIRQLELASAHDPDLFYPYESLHHIRLVQGEVDEAERLWRHEYVPRLGFDETTRERWDRAGAVRFAALRDRDPAAYEACCARWHVASDWLIVGDTARAVDTLRDSFRDAPKYDVNTVYALWLPDFDGIRDDTHFQKALSEALVDAGLPGAELRRASPED